VSTAAVPTSPAELEEVLNDPRRLGNLLKDPRDFGQFVTNYARAVNRRDRAVGQWSAGARPLTAGAALSNPVAAGAPLDRMFGTSAEFFAAIHPRNTTREAERTRGRLHQAQAALTTATGADGGFLVPEFTRSELLRSALDVAIVRPRARVVPMAAKRVPVPMVDETDRSTSSFGGVVTHWAGEDAETLEASSPRFGSVVLDAERLYAYAEAPNELVDDSAPTFGPLVATSFGEAIGHAEDGAFINGDGVRKPLGYLQASCLVEVAAEAGQPAGTVVWENLAAMAARMAPESFSRAVWVANADTLPELVTMAVSVGTGGGPIQVGGSAEAPTIYILNRPVLFTTRCPSLGEMGDISFADFRHYLIGDRQLMTARWSEHQRFDSHSTAFHVSERIDGFPWPQAPIVPENGSDPLSPFVALAARA
jgi:HK97 family phage major capsid protein